MAILHWRLCFSLIGLTAAIPHLDSNLFARQNKQCGGKTDLTSCGNGFPSGFCCGKDTTCVALNNTRIVTTICCPLGRDCSRIAPLPCNVTLQDVNFFPGSPVKTLNLTVALPKCNDQCCPAGFQCDNDECAAINDKQKATSSSSSSNRGSPASTRGPSTTDKPTGNSASTSTTSSNASTQSQTQVSNATSTSLPLEQQAPAGSGAFSGKSFAAGFIPGIVLGAAVLFGIIIFFLARRRRRRDDDGGFSLRSKSPDRLAKSRAAYAEYQAKRQISGPVPQPENSMRTDFFMAGKGSPDLSQKARETTLSPRSDMPDKVPPADFTRYRSSSFYDTTTPGFPATPLGHNEPDLAVKSLFHQSPDPKTGLTSSTTMITPLPRLPPFPPLAPPGFSTPTPNGSVTPLIPLRTKKSASSLRRNLSSRFRKASAPSPSPATGSMSRTTSKRRRLGSSWASANDDDDDDDDDGQRSLSDTEAAAGGGRASRGTIRVIMSPPRDEPMPPPRPQQQANTAEKVQYSLDTPPPPPPTSVNRGLASPFTPSKVKGEAARGRTGGGGGGSQRDTTFGEMMERAGVQPRRDLDRARGPLYR